MAPYTPTAQNPHRPTTDSFNRNEVIFDQDTIESFGWNHVWSSPTAGPPP